LRGCSIVTQKASAEDSRSRRTVTPSHDTDWNVYMAHSVRGI